MKGLKLLLVSTIAVSCFATGTKTQFAAKPVVFTLDPNALVGNKSKIQNKDASLSEAYKQLIKDAEKALKFGPVSVLEKKNDPPSGDKHDYMSLAPYYWPDTSKKDGLPYIRKDGQTNPEVKDYKDKDYMPQLCENVFVLGLAYYYSDNSGYAEHAADLLRVWFLDTATRMNPNLNFGQAMKGHNNGRGAGLIDTRHFVKLIDGIGLLKGSKYWKKEYQSGMQKWFANFLNWMQTSPNGIDEMDAPNNHGAWYDVQRLSMALFIDSADLAKKIIANTKIRLDMQMDDKGRFPKEMERTISLHYSVFVLEAFFTIAKMADKVGVDMWKYTSPSGKSLKKAFDAFYPYISAEKEWDGEQIKPYEFEEGYPVLVDAIKYFNCQKCMLPIRNIAGDKTDRLRIKLLTDINF